MAKNQPGKVWYCAIDSISANNAATPLHIVPVSRMDDSGIMLIGPGQAASGASFAGFLQGRGGRIAKNVLSAPETRFCLGAGVGRENF